MENCTFSLRTTRVPTNLTGQISLATDTEKWKRIHLARSSSMGDTHARGLATEVENFLHRLLYATTEQNVFPEDTDRARYFVVWQTLRG